MRKWVSFAAASMVAIAASNAAGAGLDAVYKHVPDDAGLVLVVPSLDKAIGGVKAFATAIGVEDTDEINADAMLDDAPGGAELYDTSGPFVISMLPDDQEVVVMAMLADPAAWRSAVEATETEGGLLTVDTGWEEFYIKLDGKLIIFGEAEDAVNAAVKASGKFGAQLAQHTAEVGGDAAAMLYMDVAEWQGTVDETWMMVQMMAPMMVMQMAGGESPPGTMEVMQYALGEIREFIRAIDKTVIAANIGSTGIELKLVGKLTPDSAVSKYLGAIKATDKSLFRGLPGINAPMVFANEWEVPPTTGSFFDGLVAEMRKAADAAAKAAEAEEGADSNGGDELVKAMESAAAMLKHTTGSSMMLLPSTDGKLSMVGYYLGRDGSALMKDVEMMNSPEFAAAFNMGEVTRDKAEVSGKSCAVYQYSVQAPDPAAAEMMKAMFGEKMTYYFFPDDHGLAYSFGERTAAEKNVALLGKSGDAKIEAFKSDLGKGQPQFAIMVDPLAMMQFGTSMAKAMGQPVPEAKAPNTDSAYAGLVGYFDKTAIKLHLNVPVKSVRPAVDFANALGEAESAAYDDEMDNEMDNEMDDEMDDDTGDGE